MRETTGKTGIDRESVRESLRKIDRERDRA